MPAALARGVGSRRYFHQQAFHVGLLHAGRLAHRLYGGFGGDQHKAQLFTQVVQALGQATFAVKSHFRTQRAFDFAAGTGYFQALVHRFFHGVDFTPVVAAQLEVFRQGSQAFVPGFVEHGVTALARKMLRAFVGGEAQDRRNPAHQGFGHMVQGGLSGTSRQAVGLGGVLAVFDDVQIETAQGGFTEVVHFLVNPQEGIVAVVFVQFVLQLQGTVDHPAVQGDHVFRRYHVLFRIKPGQVAQQEASNVTDTAVAVGRLAQDILGNGHLAAVVGGGYPQTQDVSAQFVHHFLGGDHVAHGFGHLVALAVHGEAVGEHLLVRGHAVHGDGGFQGRLEPATMLVGPFQVHIGRELAQLFTYPQYRIVGDAGIKPYVQGIQHFFVLVSVCAQQFVLVDVVPGVDAAGLNRLGYFLDQLLGVGVQFLGFLVDKQGDRHTPGALTGDTPVRALLEHGFDTVLAPTRHPADALDGFQGVGAQVELVHADEPLGGGPVDQRGFGAPSVRVAVAEFLGPHQLAFTLQRGTNRLVSLVYVYTGKFASGIGVGTVGFYQVDGANAVRLAYFKVFHTVVRRGANGAGTGIPGDVATQQHRHLLVVHRMVQQLVFQGGTDHVGQHLIIFHAPAGHDALHHIGGQDHALRAVAGIQLHQGVFQIRTDRHRLVGGDGPGGGGPDHHGDIALAVVGSEGFEDSVLIHGGETHVDLGRGFVLVFNFGFCQCGLTNHTPVNRLEPTHQVTLGHDLAQRPHNTRFNFRVHGQVGLVPLAHHAQADEVGFLAFDLLGGVIAAGLAEGFVIHLHTGFADFLLHLVLARQAVAIPAGHIGCVIAHETAGFHDHVFQDLVDRMPDVNAAVGVGRAIVQDELFPAFALFAQVAVYVQVLPSLEHVRLAIGQVTAHGKRSFRQIQGMLVVAHVFVRTLGWSVESGVRRGRVVRQPGPGMLEIPGDLLPKLVNRVEFHFVPQAMAEHHVQMLAIKCASKVEQVHFQ